MPFFWFWSQIVNDILMQNRSQDMDNTSVNGKLGLRIHLKKLDIKAH